MRTPTQHLADVLLDEPVEQWITTQRAAGKRWHTVAADLRTVTGGRVDVSPQAVQGWFRRARNAEPTVGGAA